MKQLGVPALWLGVAITVEVVAAFALFSAMAFARQAVAAPCGTQRSR